MEAKEINSLLIVYAFLQLIPILPLLIAIIYVLTFDNNHISTFLKIIGYGYGILFLIAFILDIKN